ncbi:membrane progestin receptor gamma isoform X3 [Peromyscus leucopus]|uniref:membrane progestin receptor gamma isoform X3 n=1 Tax=Peromyscus leucopus TaxID=10041 RepID=UPI0018858627|nr:membrane progestin receptor gamma isoform X3 [Peromyscus leucopus]
MLSRKLPRLFRIDQVPQVFHEQGILFGYRHPQSSATACILSLFQMTNETLNIWTHLLPFWFFVWRFVTALYMTDIQNDSYSWPMLVYMCTSCVYPLASSCAHTFSSMSRNARHICYFLDYGAVNLFSLGSAIAYSAYTFPDALVCSTFHECYVALAVLNTILSTGLSCYSRLSFAAGEAGPFAPRGSTFSDLVTRGLKSQETRALGDNPHQVSRTPEAPALQAAPGPRLRLPLHLGLTPHLLQALLVPGGEFKKRRHLVPPETHGHDAPGLFLVLCSPARATGSWTL